MYWAIKSPTCPAAPAAAADIDGGMRQNGLRESGPVVNYCSTLRLTVSQSDDLGKMTSASSSKTSVESPGASRATESLKISRKLLRLSRRASNKERRLANNTESRRARRQRSLSLDACEQPSSSSGEFEGADVSTPDQQSTSCHRVSSSDLLQHSKGWSRRLTRSLHRHKKSAENFIGETTRDKKRRGSVFNPNVALHEAVEKEDVKTVNDLLSTTDSLFDVNSVNEDGFSVLDIALLVDNELIAKLLMSHGARTHYINDRMSGSDLMMKLDKLSCIATHNSTDVHTNLTDSTQLVSSQSKENDRISVFWDSRRKLYNNMKTVYRNSVRPGEPTNVKLFAGSDSSLFVTFNAPQDVNNGITINYKVEWSRFENFVPLVGHQILDDPQCLEYEIPDLVPGIGYFVRVSAGNMRGFGRPTVSTPALGIPSNWKELDDFQSRWDNKLQTLDELFVNIKNFHQLQGIDTEDLRSSVISLPIPPRKSSMKRSIRNLFASSPKFQRTLKRGVYLTALVCHGDQMLITNDDNIPTVQVDDVFTTNSTLNNDYYWLLKVACTWKDVRSLKQKLEKSCSPGPMEFRCRLLRAITQLQNALGLQDLGQFYHHPVRDSNGSVVLVTVKHIASPKVISRNPQVKWSTLEKVQRRCGSAYDSDSTAFDRLGAIVGELSKCHKAKSVLLERGLYLGYLKLQSSVDRICIMVPQHMPNVLPYAKIRDCPNVSREEWKWIRDSADDQPVTVTDSQTVFHNQLIAACTKLLTDMGIDKSEWPSHRLHDTEVIELNSDVTFLLLLPNAQNICAVPGHSERTHHTCTTLPIQVFEMNNMHSYKHDFISRYSRLSSTLEIDQHLAQQSVRQAFSTDEVQAAKQRIHQLGQIQLRLDEAWRGIRWTMDVIIQARDRSSRSGLPLSVLFATDHSA